MELSSPKNTEIKREQPQTPMERYWSILEKAVDSELLEKTKRDLKLEEAWDSLLEDDDSIFEEIDMTEQIEKLLKEYLDDIKNNSEYPDTIEDDGEQYEKLSPEETAEKRAEFKANRERLIKGWEEKNGMEWPRYEPSSRRQHANCITNYLNIRIGSIRYWFASEKKTAIS